MEYFDEATETGEKTGNVYSRQDTHKYGYRHNVVHIWLVNSKNQILLQKRSAEKESYPNMWEVSCSGHISAGDDNLAAAKRELEEELGIEVDEKDIEFAFMYNIYADENSSFKNNENAYVYVVRTDKEVQDFNLQEDEVSAVKYFELDELAEMGRNKDKTLVAAGPQHVRIVEFIKNKIY